CNRAPGVTPVRACRNRRDLGVRYCDARFRQEPMGCLGCYGDQHLRLLSKEESSALARKSDDRGPVDGPGLSGWTTWLAHSVVSRLGQPVWKGSFCSCGEV